MSITLPLLILGLYARSLYFDKYLAENRERAGREISGRGEGASRAAWLLVAA